MMRCAVKSNTIAIFVLEVWLFLQLSSKGFYFLVQIQKVFSSDSLTPSILNVKPGVFLSFLRFL
ncbi:hypothetical protein HanIR_Chr02g0089181 [Helianthus annuus]|nr:hypothetical protein HanIR_Chr02g0089181 [Helianthus annuus]